MRFQHLIIALFLLVGSCIQAQVVKDFRVVGSKVLPNSTIEKLLVIKKSQDVKRSDLNHAIKEMYRSGLFERIEMKLDKEVLVIQVVENPVIRKVRILNAGELTDDQKNTLKKEYKIKKGEILNPQKLREFIFDIESIYELQGFENAHVEYELKHMGKSSVDVHITVHSGEEVRAQSIKFIGNTQFYNWTLSRMIGFRQSHFLSVILKDDLFSKTQLASGLILIKEAYIDKGFMDISIKKTVKYDNSANKVKVVLNIDEGKPYIVSKIGIEGLKIVQKDFGSIRQDQIKAKLEGKRFNRNDVLKLKDYLVEYFATKGYSSVDVGIRTRLNKHDHTMNVDFIIHKGNLTQVRFINFFGNLNTEDNVLRRSFKQQENTQYSRYAIQESERRLMNLPYISKVDIQTVPVSKDKVDLNVTVKEEKTSMIKGELGYIEQQGFAGNVSYEDSNILGTGQAIQTKAGLSKSGHELSLIVSQPYFWGTDYTQDISVSSKKTNFGKIKRDNYTIDGFKLSWGLSKSISDNISIGGRLSYTYDRFYPKDTSGLMPHIADFINQYGSEYRTLGSTVSLGYSHLDQFVQPSSGVRSSINIYRSLSENQTSLPYYTVNWSGTHFSRWMQRYVDDYWILRMHAGVGYGRSFGRLKGDLPFYHRYHVGGIGSIRGYESSSLGKRSSNGISQGGNTYVNFNNDLIIPILDQRFLVPSVFFDAGGLSMGSIKTSDLRYSVGVSAQVVTPVGPVALAFANPLNIKDGERRKRFSMTIGKIFN